MSMTLSIPANYSYVVATAVGTYWLNFWMGMRVGRFRKEAAVPYPQAYAEVAQATASPAANRFNCAQRAHQNTLEMLPSVVMGLLVTGLKHPLVATVLGSCFLVGRVFFFNGYASGDPKKRISGGGGLHYLGTVGLLLSSTYTAVELVGLVGKVKGMF